MNDDRCFEWCLARALFCIDEDHPERITKEIKRSC